MKFISSVGAVALAVIIAGSGCPPANRPATETGTAPPPCRVSTVGLAAPSIGGLRPAVAARTTGAGAPADERFAVAWLELGDREAVHVALLDGEARLVAPPAEAAAGLHGLRNPRLAPSPDGFTLAFSGRDAADREGVLLASVGADGALGTPRLAVPAAGARALAVVDMGTAHLVAWYGWNADPAELHVSRVPRGGGEVRSVAVGPVPYQPSMELVAAPAGARAVWVGKEVGPDGNPRETVYRGVFDLAGRLTGPPLALGVGLYPSLALVGADARGGTEMVLIEKWLEGRLWLGRVRDGRVEERPAPEGDFGALGRRGGAVVACVAAPSPTADGEEIRCAEIDAEGRAGPMVDVAGGAEGVSGLALAGTGNTTAVVWQQDDASVGSALGVALVTCGP